MALLDILDCTMDELIEPVAAEPAATTRAAARWGSGGVGDLRPKRARITEPGRGPVTGQVPDVLADPVGVIVDLVAGVEPALARATVVGGGHGGGGRPGDATSSRCGAGRAAVAADRWTFPRTPGRRRPADRAAQPRRGEHLAAVLRELRQGAAHLPPPRPGLVLLGVRACPSAVRPVRDTRRVGFRDRQGRPRCCGAARPTRTATPPRSWSRSWPGWIPRIPADAVADAVATVTSQAGQRRQLAWALQDRPEPAHRRPAPTPRSRRCCA